ncbi:hypothetical protein GCM10010433_21890 [Streptomyces pulveraceus]
MEQAQAYRASAPPSRIAAATAARRSGGGPDGSSAVDGTPAPPGRLPRPSSVFPEISPVVREFAVSIHFLPRSDFPSDLWNDRPEMTVDAASIHVQQCIEKKADDDSKFCDPGRNPHLSAECGWKSPRIRLGCGRLCDR